MTANAGDVVALARLYAVIGSFLAHAPGALGGDTRAALEDARARLGMDARRIERETKR